MSIESFGIGPDGFSIGIGGGGQSTRKTRVNMRLARESAALDRATTYDQAFDNIGRFREANLGWDQQYTDMDVRAAKQKQLNEIAAMRESGLHPAFSAGIGGAGPASLVGGGPTVSGGVQGYAVGGGRSGGSASFKLVNKSVAEFNAANKDLIQARADLIKEQIQDIRDARGHQGQSGVGVPGGVEVGGFDFEDAKVKSRQPQNPNIVAGPPKPGMVRIQVTPTSTMLVPDNEVLEADSAVGIFATIWANMEEKDRVSAMKKARASSMRTRSATYPKPWLKRQKIPRSSAPYQSRWPSHHYK